MKPPKLRYPLLIISSALLTAFPAIVGAWPMHALRREYGRVGYWFGVFLIAGLFAALQEWYVASVALSLGVMIGTYTEVEDHSGSVFYSGAIAVLASVGMLAVSGGVWQHLTKKSIVAEYREAVVVPLVDEVTKMASVGTHITVDEVIQKTPSAVLISLIVALAIALILGPGRRVQRLDYRARLLAYRVPDIAVWLAIAAVAGAYVKQSPEWLQSLSNDCLRVLMVLFFFQGLAVVAQAFRVFRVSQFGRTLGYALIILNLVVVSFVGFVDFWLEFRSRLSRKELGANVGGAAK